MLLRANEVLRVNWFKKKGFYCTRFQMATTETDPFFSMCRHKIILVVSTGCPVLAEKALQGVLESSVFDHTLSDAKLNAFLGKNEWIHSSTIYWYGVENVFKTRALAQKNLVLVYVSNFQGTNNLDQIDFNSPCYFLTRGFRYGPAFNKTISREESHVSTIANIQSTYILS